MARSRGWAEPLAVTGLFTLLTLAMTWPWAAHVGEAINPFGDVIVQMTSLRWNAHALVTNPAGLFEAPFFYPYAHSLAFSENLLGQTLVALPLLLLTGNPALAANFNILLSFVLTGLFTYLLVRDLTGSRAAGLLSGVAFAFCPFRFMQMGHLHMLATAWFPFTLWALLGVGGRGSGVGGQGPGNTQYALRPTPYVLFALGFIVMGLSSIYYTYFLALAVLLYFVWWAFDALLGPQSVGARHASPWLGSIPLHSTTPKRAQQAAPLRTVDFGLLLRLGLALIVVGVALAPVFLPYWQSSQELGFSRSTYEVQNWAADWGFYGKVLQSNWLYGKVLAPGMVSVSGERELFPGIVATLLALVGIVLGRGRARFYYLLLGLVSLVLTFGLSGRVPGTSIDVTLPYAFLYDWIPGFKALRVPVRFAVLLDLSIYVLAGYGLAVVSGQWSVVSARLRPLVTGRWPLTTILTGLVLLEFVNPLDTNNRRDVTAQLQAAEPYGWLARAENSGPLLELPMTAGQDDVWYTFFDTRHWQPLVNGWSSFVPPGTVRLKQALESFPDPFTASLLQGLEVRHVLVHLWQFPREARADLKRRLDATPELEMVDQAGDNYVYRLAPDPWLRRIAAQVGDGTLWVGEARHGSMPTLEVLAYALLRWGIPASHMGGNIAIGYRPLGSLPFGTAPDYALVASLPSQVGRGGSRTAPAGSKVPGPALDSGLWTLDFGNAAVSLLKRDPLQLKTYDLSAPHPPPPGFAGPFDPENIRLSVGASSIAFGGSPLRDEGKGKRVSSLTLLSFAPANVTVRLGSRAGQVEKKLHLPAGITRYDTPGLDAPYDLEVLNDGSVRLLRAELWGAGELQDGQGRGGSRTAPTGATIPGAGQMPLEVTPSKAGPGSGTLDTRLRVVPTKDGGDFTATIDVYVEPWGTHPEGHFGSWSVVLPADGAGHDYTFHLDSLAKTVSTTRDGQPVETFAWVGPPTQGDFRAGLSITRAGRVVAELPLYVFTLEGGRLTDWQMEPASLAVVQP